MPTCPQCLHTWETSKRPLTERQAQVLRYIEDSILQRDYAPSHDEIAERFGFQSLATVHEHLTNIERKGYITRRYRQARAIELVA